MAKAKQRRQKSLPELSKASLGDTIFTEERVREIVDAVGVRLPSARYKDSQLDPKSQKNKTVLIPRIDALRDELNGLADVHISRAQLAAYPLPPSDTKKQLGRIENTSTRLLEALQYDHIEAASRLHPQIKNLIGDCLKESEDDSRTTTYKGKIGKTENSLDILPSQLVEHLTALLAALEQSAILGQQKMSVLVGQSRGNTSNWVTYQLIADISAIYEKYWRKAPGLGRSTQGDATGPFIRFCKAVVTLLGEGHMSNEAIASYVQRLRKSYSREPS